MVSVELQRGHSHRHVKLVGAFDAEHYELPGVGRPPDFAVPVHVFEMNDIVGSHLHLVEVYEGKVRLAKEAGTYVLSERVSGAIDRNNKQRRYGTLDEVAHSDGTVRLVFGPNPVIEEYEERAIADLSGISTPPTPDPFH